MWAAFDAAISEVAADMGLFSWFRPPRPESVTLPIGPPLIPADATAFSLRRDAAWARCAAAIIVRRDLRTAAHLCALADYLVAEAARMERGP